MKGEKENGLLGDWVIDPTDYKAIREYGIVSMSFTEDGRLIYRIKSSEGTNIILLTYRVHNQRLITNQPSAPKVEKTSFAMTPEGKLILLYADTTCRFVRA